MAEWTATDPLAKAERVSLRYRLPKTTLFGPERFVHAVNDVSFEIEPNTTLGLVGESGSGKSSLGRVVASLQPATEGAILFKGRDLADLSKAEWRAQRREIQMIFQDAAGALNPRLIINKQLREVLDLHRIGAPSDRHERIMEILDAVSLDKTVLDKYSHQLSGGQRQRIIIARALLVGPTFAVCDEPVSSVDVSVQAQILNLLIEQQQQRSLTYLFITHDLNVVRHISDRIAVMYLGQIVELATSNELATTQLHPYTKGLVAAIPVPDPRRRNRDRTLLPGAPPSPFNVPVACVFAQRCRHATEICTTERPPLRAITNDHQAACHHAERLS